MRSTPEPKSIYLVFCLTLVQGQLDSKEEMNQHIYDEANAAFDG